MNGPIWKVDPLTKKKSLLFQNVEQLREQVERLLGEKLPGKGRPVFNV